MNNLIALTSREWKAFWYSPIAYVVGACFLLLQGFIFWLLLTALNDPLADPSWIISQAFFGTFFYWMIALAIPPLLTMRTLSEEKRTGTMEVLLSAPVTDWQGVGAKFLGAWLAYGALWAMTIIYFLVLGRLTALDWGPILTGYLGTMLLGGVFIAIGVLASSLTRNQIIAAVLGFVLMLLVFATSFVGFFVTDPSSKRMIEYFSILDHVRDFARGIVDTRPLVCYASLIVIALFLAVRAIASPRWRA